jgi:CBS domain containing-hemolysin-like protein
VSFLCSLLEAALLSVRTVELVDRAGSGDGSAQRLLAIKEERIDDALAAILTLNTVANTIGAALAGAEAGRLWGGEKIWLVSLVSVFTAALAFGILVFSEIVPKTLGAVYASKMVGFVSRAISAMMWSLRPVLFLTRGVTGLLTRDASNAKAPSRGEILAMVAMAAREGALGADDSRLLANVLRYNEIVVDDVMTPRTVVCMLPQETTVGELLSDENCLVYSRLPLFDGSRDHVTGYVLQREVLVAAARGTDHATPLKRFLRPACFIPEGQTVGRVLRRLIEQREHMGLVTDEYGGISGIVTLEDLVETTLGVEILDESDRVADLRAEAAKLRERRLASMRQWHQPLAADHDE